MCGVWFQIGYEIGKGIGTCEFVDIRQVKVGVHRKQRIFVNVAHRVVQHNFCINNTIRKCSIQQCKW